MLPFHLGMMSGAPMGGVAVEPIVERAFLDYQNAVYRLDGVSNTFAGHGGTFADGASIVSGQGALCVNTAAAVDMPYNLGTTSNVMLTIYFVVSPDDGIQKRAATIFDNDSGTAKIESLFLGGSPQYWGAVTNDASGSFTVTDSASISGVVKQSIGFTNGNAFTCLNGGTVNKSSGTANFTFNPGIIRAGNGGDTASQPYGQYIRKIIVQTGEFSDAYIQAA